MSGEDDAISKAAYSFHQEMISHAKDVLALTNPSRRQVSSITMAISEKQFRDIRAKLREVEDWVTHYLANSPDTPETVFHLNMLLFPASNAAGKGDKT
jgi:uncharacterized protein (TIGR02147 family)